MAAAYYQASFVDFLEESTESILGKIVQSHVFALEQTQRDAWVDEITIMKSAVRDLGLGHILFEFFIPRMGKRADVVVVQATTVTVVEFKVGSYLFDRAAIEQVHDYALDLKNFHQGSHHCPIIPVLVATKARPTQQQSLRWAKDQVAAPILASVEPVSYTHLDVYKRQCHSPSWSWRGSPSADPRGRARRRRPRRACGSHARPAGAR